MKAGREGSTVTVCISRPSELSGGRGQANEIPELPPVGVALDGRAIRTGPCDAPQGKICPGR
ncbi:MAG: hypothetical protein WCJ93_06310 [Methanomicrobiales archaeon]